METAPTKFLDTKILAIHVTVTQFFNVSIICPHYVKIYYNFQKPRESDQPRKKEMRGKKPRIFTEASFEKSTASTNGHLPNPKPQSVDDGKPTPVNSVNSNTAGPSEKKSKFLKVLARNMYKTIIKRKEVLLY